MTLEQRIKRLEQRAEKFDLRIKNLKMMKDRSKSASVFFISEALAGNLLVTLHGVKGHEWSGQFRAGQRMSFTTSRFH